MDKLVSVTQVLAPFINFDNVPEHVLTRATERGSKVHAICAAICQGLWIPPIPPECAGYIASFQTWFDQYVEEVIFVEKELVDPVYGYLGHPDFYGKLKGIGYALLDWKTPITLYKQWKVQLSAYKRLLEINKKQIREYKFVRAIDVVASLQLDPQGGIPKMERYENSVEDLNVFFGLLNAHNYFAK